VYNSVAICDACCADGVGLERECGSILLVVLVMLGNAVMSS
jgi:hypothetical protein